MVNVINVLGILDAFENMKDSKSLSPDDKKLVARELLSNIPEEIMAPGCRNTSNAVRVVIRSYLGVDNGRTEKPKAESPVIAESDATESPKEPEASAVVGGPRVASSAHRPHVKAPRGGKANRGS